MEKSILVVDDESLVAEYLAQVLQEFGFQTTTAADVESALTLFHAHAPFSAAFVDLGLSDRSGLELIAELQQLHPDLPIVLATGYAHMAESDGNESNHTPVILAKPYDVAAIKAALINIGLLA